MDRLPSEARGVWGVCFFLLHIVLVNMSIPIKDLVVGEIYLGFHVVENSEYYLIYQGQENWSPGQYAPGSLQYVKLKTNSKNFKKIIPLIHWKLGDPVKSLGVNLKPSNPIKKTPIRYLNRI